ncbi:MAG: putative bifunctional diguanylate cyclase/phosphodiesterase [Pseudonocardiaceae bacterium]
MEARVRSCRTDVPPSRGRALAPRVFVAVLATAAGLAAAAVVYTAPFRADFGTLLGGLALVAGFGLARYLAIEVEVRRDTARITPTEIPLVIGLLFLPAAVVLAAYVGVVIIARLLRGDNWVKLLFNASYATLTVALTDLLARLVVHPMWPWLPSWTEVLAGFVIAHAITSCLTWAFFVLLDHRRPGESARPVVHVYLTGLLNAGLGLAAAEIVQTVRWGWLLAALLAAMLAVVYRAYYGLLRDQRDLGVLNDFSLQVAVSGRGHEDDGGAGDGGNSGNVDGRLEVDDAGWSTAMELAREQLNATRVVLHRMPAEGGLRTMVAGRPMPRQLSYRGVSTLLIGGPLAKTSKVLHLMAGSHDPVIAGALIARGASEALVAPLRGANQLLGVIEVHDRQSRIRGFGDADVRLVETLASHLTTAMDNRRLLARLRHDAYHDNLTDLRNRLGFREAANEVLMAESMPCAVLVVDLDLLSSVNDALGHIWGDNIVQAAGDRLRRALTGVLTARLEGDTFAALLVDVEENGALQVCAQVRAALSTPYSVDKLAVECSPVVGVALTWIEPSRDVDVLLQRADVALHAARSGDGPVRAYAPSMGQVFLRRFQLVTQFRQALDTGQVDVHFQPQLALLTRQVIGVEALVRWHHPEFGMLDPEEFVAIVEATGLIDALTGFVLDRSLQQCRSWLDRGLSLMVSVNLSVRNLADTEFPRRVADALVCHRVPSALLGFELTESAVMSDPERALPVLRRLHGMGIRIAVDDFGTGYSSLAYLRRLPVDEVKIDKSFVLGLASDLGDLAVVRAIVDLGHSLGLTVVAEGVEEDATRDQLMEMGCDIAQGYLISRPLGAERFDAWLQARTVRARGTHDETVLTLVR